jgi:DNA-binding beta-propeller fold protein YncE
MAIKIQGSTIIDDSRRIVGVSTLFVDNVDPTTIGLTTQFNVNAQETNVVGVTFDDEGTRMQILGNVSDIVKQYSLGTPWDISTASYLSGQDYDDVAGAEPRCVVWSWGGKYFYTNNTTTVYQHECRIAFDLSSAFYTGKNYNYSAETSTTGIQVQFKKDGTKMYVSESTNDRIYQYTLATPWDVSTASYDSVFASFNSVETDLKGFAFNPTGTKLLICGQTNDSIIYYTLSEPYNLNTLNLEGTIITGLNNPHGIYWRKDGGKIYVANLSNDEIVEYSLTRYNSQINNYFSGDVEVIGDTEFYGNNEFYGDIVSKNNLKVNSVSAGSSSIGIRTSEEYPTFSVSLESNELYITNINPQQISGIVTSFSIVGQEGVSEDIAFSNNGTKMFIVGSAGDDVTPYSLSTPWSVDTATYLSGEEFAAGIGDIRGITWSSDGLNLYLTTSDDVFQYITIKAFDTLSLTSVGSTIINAQTSTSAQSIRFKEDGTKFYVSSSGGDEIFQYTCATPWDITTSSYDNVSYSFNSVETNLTGFDFSGDGTKLLITGQAGDDITYFTLTRPWDISSANLVGIITTLPETVPQGLFWRNDGRKVYIVGTTDDRVYEYNIPQTSEIDITATAQFHDTAEFYGGVQFYNKVTTYGDLDVEGIIRIGNDNPGAELSINGVSDLSNILRTNNIENSYIKNNKHFYVGLEEITPYGVQFKTDGTRMYVLGDGGNDITEYELSTPWEVSTAGVTTYSYTISQDTVPTDLIFKSDGTKLFVTGSTNDRVYEYSISTPWDLSTVGFTTQYQLENQSVVYPSALEFSADGATMLVLNRDGARDSVYEYTLSTPWSVDTAVGPNSSFYVGQQQTDPFGVSFDPSGTHMYIVGIVQNVIHQYELATPFDVRTASYTGKTLGTNDSDTTNVFIKPDGTQIFIIGYASDRIRTFDLGTPFDVSTGVASTIFLVGAGGGVGETLPYGLWFKPDGSEMYMVGDTLDTIYQYTLSTPWDLATAGVTTTRSILPEIIIPTQVGLSSTGDKMYIADHLNSSIIQYDLSVAWDISSAAGFTTAYYLGEAENDRIGSFTFNPDGTQIYLTDNADTDKVSQYTLTTPWDIGSATWEGAEISVAFYETAPEGMKFNSFGTKLFITGYTNDKIYQYGLTTPYDISTAYFEKDYYIGKEETLPRALTIGDNDTKLYLTGTTSDIVWQYEVPESSKLDLDYLQMNDDSFYLVDGLNPVEANPVGLSFRPDGKRMFVSVTDNDRIIQYELSNAWDVRTAVRSKIWRMFVDNFRTIETGIEGIYFRNDGRRLFVIGTTNDKVYSFELSEPWEITSITKALGEFYVNPQESTPRSLHFSSDGIYMYIVGDTSDRVHQYTLSTAWDVTTATITRNLNIAAQLPTAYGLSFSGDGTRMYAMGSSADRIYEYLLIEPWNISAYSIVRSYDVKTKHGLTTPRGLYMRHDREEFFIVDNTTVRVHKFTIPSNDVVVGSQLKVFGDIVSDQSAYIEGSLNANNAYFETLGIGTEANKNNQDLVSKRFAELPSIGIRPDISQLEIESDIFFCGVSGILNQPSGITFKPDGKTFYVSNIFTTGSINCIVQYQCEEAWNIKTASYQKYVSLAEFGILSGVNNVTFNPDGTKAYIGSYQTNASKIVELELDSPWDITSISRSGFSLITTGFGELNEGRIIRSHRWSPDGTRLYVVKENNPYIFEFTLTTPWDLSTATKNFVMRYTEQYLPENPIDIAFNDDGTQMILAERARADISYSLFSYNLKTPYDLSTANWSGVAKEIYSFNVYSIFFKPDGKTLFAVSLSETNIKSFTLESPFDITTIQKPNFSGIIADNIESLRFVQDGTKLIGKVGDTSYVVVYDLKEPYDIGSINRIENNRQWSEFWEIGVCYDVPYFSPDGMRAYVAVHAGSRSGTMELQLQNPYDFSSMWKRTHWLGQYYLSGGNNDKIISVALNDDGTRLYELNFDQDEIYEHELTIPWDLKSARRTDPKYYTLVTEPYAVGFGTDGTKMYVLNQANGLIYEHETTDPSVTYDVRTMGYLGITTTTVATTNTRDFGFNNDGTKLYTLEVSTDSIHERTLTYPGNIQVSTGATSYSFAGDGLTNPTGFEFKPDGTILYVTDNTADRVYQYAVATPYAVDTISGLTTSFDLSSQAPAPRATRFSDDGYRMYVLNYTGTAPYDNNIVYQYELSTAWDIDTATYNGSSFNVTNQAITPLGFRFSPDGKRMLVCENSQDFIYQYELSIPWDITTASYETTTLNIRNTQGGAITGQPRSLRFSPDGYTLFFTNYASSNNNNRLYQYDLQTPWKVSTASFTSEYIWNKVSRLHPRVRGYHINWDTGEIYIPEFVSDNFNYIIKYKLPDYEKNKTEVFGGLEVYGKSHFKSPIEVEGKSEFYNVGIGTIGSEYSKLTVQGNSNLPYISSSEMDIENWYQGSDDSFWVGLDKVTRTTYTTSPESVAFDDIGSRMYILDRIAPAGIQQYKLSTLWDITTAKLESGLDVNDIEVTPNGIAFGGIGTDAGKYFYVVGETGDTVYQYELSTGYDLSTAGSGFTTSFSVNAQETIPESVGFSTGGDKMFITGSTGDDITEYTLSTPWNIDSATYVTEASVSSQDADPRESYFKPDGTKVWMIGANNDTIFEYNLTTPWDISTLTYANKSLKIEKTGEIDPMGLYFSPDGKNMYFCGTVMDRVWRYRLSTPWDISTATIRRQSSYFIDQNEDLLSSGITDFDISSLGHKLYAISSTGQVYEYDLTTPWKVESLSYTGRLYNTYSSDAFNASNSLKFSPDGTKYYTSTGNTYKIAEYTLTTPWDITSSVYSGALTTAGEHYNPLGLEFSHDGTRMYLGAGFGVVWEYELLEPWSIVGARPASDSFGLVEREGLSNNNADFSFPSAINFKPDGTKMYWTGDNQDKIFQVDLENAWEVRTGVQVAEYLLSSDGNTTPNGFTFKPDGTQLYQTNYTGKLIVQYNLTTPWEIDSISGITTQLSTTTGVNFNPIDVRFKTDGTKMFVAPYSSDGNVGAIREYDLSVAWDVSSATYNGKFFDVPAETQPRSIQFTEDGKTLYVSGDIYQRIIQFKLDVAWDLSSVRPWSTSSHPVFDITLYPENVITSDLELFYSHYISPDGSKLYFTNQYQLTMLSNRVWQLELETPYDITTAKMNNRGFLSGYAFNTTQYLFGNGDGLAFNGTGSHLYLLDSARDRINEFALTTPYKLDTAVATNRYINIAKEYFGGEATPQGLVLKKDGTKLYFSGTTRHVVWELDIPSQDIEITGNTIVHGDLEVQYKLDANDVEANRISVSDSISIGSSDGSAYATPLTVYGKADITKISNTSNFNQFVRNNDSFAINEDGTPAGISFKPDGKTMYVVGSASEEINQYSLTTPWDIKTATFVQVKSLSGITTDVRSLTIKPDGTQFYVTDLTPDRVVQLTASTPWDVATLTSVGSTNLTQDTLMSGLHIGTGGTTMYTTGYANDRIYQYSLSTAWDVTTAGFTTQFSIGTGATTPANTQPEGIYVNPSETKVYTTSAIEDRIYEYTLSTPSDVSTASLTTSFALRNDGLTYGMTFNPNGREFYITNDNPDKVFKYTLTTPYTLNTIQYPEGILNVGFDGNGNSQGFYIRPDGKKLYSVEYNDASQDLFEYDLATPWKLNTATLKGIRNYSDNYLDVFFKPDGTKMYMTNYNNAATSSVDEYTLTTPWDSSTAGLTTSFVTGGDDTQPNGITFEPDGTRFWVCGNQNDYIYPYEMTTPWDLTTARKVSEDFFVGNEETAPTSLAFDSTGNKLYILGDTGNDITQYDIEYGYEYDVRYASYSGITTNLGALDTKPEGLTFKPDGTKLWMAGDSTDTIYEYTLSTPWNVGTAGFTTSLLVSSRTTTPTEIRFSDDGYNAYVLDYQNNGILQYSLATAWDISSATNVYRNFYYATLIYNGATGVTGFEFGKNGTRLYLSNGSGSSTNGSYRTYQFNLSEAWNIETAELITSYKHHNSTNRTEYAPRGIVFKPDGTQFSVVGQNYDRVVTHKLKTPWEIETAYYDGVWTPIDTYNTVTTYGSQTLFFDFNSDGTKAYLSTYGVDRIYEWNLTVPYRFYSAIPNYNYSYNLGAGGDIVTIPVGIRISPDDEKFFIVNNVASDYRIYEYKLPKESIQILGKTEVKSLSANAASIQNLHTNTLSSDNIDVRGDVRVGINTSQGLILTSPNGTTFRLVVDDSGTLSAISTTL